MMKLLHGIGRAVLCLILAMSYCALLALPENFEESGDKSLTYLEQDLSGTVTDQQGKGLMGASVRAVGTNLGALTDANGKFKLRVPDDVTTLSVSYVGYETQKIEIANRTNITIELQEAITSLDEVVVIGYGTQKKSDLTGAVVRADIEAFREQPNVSLIQSLQGSVAGLNVGQVDAAGENPAISIRGRTSISGQQSPLIVLDGTIYRGQLIDINPNDIASVDILKDASATAVYGSQAANGVILITSKSGTANQKTTISYTASFTSQDPIVELRPGNGAAFNQHIIDGDMFDSRTESSGYIDIDPNYDPSTRFKTGDMITAFNAGLETNWFDLLTRDNASIMSHNLSLSHKNENVSTFMSIGYTDQLGYHVGEDYKRWNARLNLDNYVTDWLTVGIQSFVTNSDFSGLDISRARRYLSPYALARDANGELTVQPGGLSTNTLRDIEEADHQDTRLNLFGNVYAKVDFPFLKGLTYKINYSTNYSVDNDFVFRPYGQNFQGSGSKSTVFNRSYSSDNILTYDNQITDDHHVTATLLYGFEKRNGNGTAAGASVFLNDALGFHQLEAGQSDLQTVETSAYEEASLYSMARLFYGFQGKYLLTGTVRRDGFSGFGVGNKFGVFPSASFAWVLSEESFLNPVTALNMLKVRAAYGTSGNRTIGRYATLARVAGAFNYVDANGSPLFGQSITTLANPGLQWETTTGLNLGIDFAVLNARITGSVDYYNNETTDVLYQVNLPRIARFPNIPVNLGRLENRGVDIILSTVNIQKEDFTWTSSLNFSRNRDELAELLGFDNDGDGVEDDIVDAGLFIGQPLNTIYGLQITGEMWQLGEEIPSGFDLGSFKIEDLSGDGEISPDDRTILGYRDPDFRLSLQNEVRYKNFTLRVFINSIQGGKDRYLAEDMLTSWNSINSENVFDRNFPVGLEYWTPENPNARYQRLFINVAGGLQGRQYIARNFVRLQDVSLSYEFPTNLIDNWNIARLKLFISGKNLATWTDYPGWDPETAWSAGSGNQFTTNGRPVMKGYSAGLNLEF